MDASVSGYLDTLRDVCAEVLGDDLIAVWLVGSLAMRDFRPDRSDIDVLVVSERTVDHEAKQLLARRLRHRSLPCPALGLDLQVYRRSEVANLQRVPDYELSVVSGRDWSDEIGVGGAYSGGLLDLAAARDTGRSIYGPDPQITIGACPREWVRQEMTKTLLWHQSRIHDEFHDPKGSNAVLNACRAMHFHATGCFVSKAEGARWYLEKGISAVVSGALAERQALSDHRLGETEVLIFLERAVGRLSGWSK